MNRWENIDKELNKYLSKYKNKNIDLQDEIQNIFNSIDWSFENANKPINKTQKDKLIRIYEKAVNMSIMTSYVGYIARKTINKKNISNLDALSLLLQIAYLKQDKELDEMELLKNVSTIAYNEANEEVGGKKKFNILLFLLPLLALPNKLTGNVWSEYKESNITYNAEQIKRQVLINLQQNKKLNINNVEFKNIINSQNNRYLYKKKDNEVDKWRGSLDTQISYLVNNAVLNAYLNNEIEKVRYIAILDDRTTLTCEGLAGQEFYLNQKNTFYKWSEYDNKDVRYVVDGMESGVNLPPLHYNCRSTIEAIRQ